MQASKGQARGEETSEELTETGRFRGKQAMPNCRTEVSVVGWGWFPMAAIKHYHRLRSRGQQEFRISQFYS